ncbi:MAG: hypothetical protein U1G07_17895 [Verrucomicrobiota bacterium]
MDLIGQVAIVDHMVDAGGGFLLPSGVGVAMKGGGMVSRRHGCAIPGDPCPQRAAESAPVGFVIPQMNASVVHRVQWLLRQKLRASASIALWLEILARPLFSQTLKASRVLA